MLYTTFLIFILHNHLSMFIFIGFNTKLTQFFLYLNFFSTFYICYLSFFTLNIPNVTSFRFHTNYRNIAKLNQFHVFGSKKKGSRLVEDEADTAISMVVLERLHTECETKLKSIEDQVKSELAKICEHKAAPSLIGHILIQTETGRKQLRYLASIVNKGNFELEVTPFSMENLYGIFSTLSNELTGYNVKLMPSFVSIVIPQMGSDMKKKSQENVKRIMNMGMEQIRLARQNSMKSLKNMESGLSQDMLFKQKVF
ncbi:uncharacterized protein TA14705 [Theileria annulata]|uniref:Ribosome recycling factor domain-containing protein n=1 Tax=Theileria annulata TaxID=5874 RepID=Q4UF68_THEAN|nr:uncharacterized protein TA14705 [Theileria annulata]CAI74271.1 hypothetical protein TA14705 [Theileria annulata]|eukprot:XP_952003.1 hypothetical protein TA14705 [Theileria annulata]